MQIVFKNNIDCSGYQHDGFRVVNRIFIFEETEEPVFFRKCQMNDNKLVCYAWNSLL